MKKTLLYMVFFFASVNVWSQITITESGGWLESAFVKWTDHAATDSYNVYYTGGGQTDVKIDRQLIRNYGTYFRADVLGIAAGSYTLKIVPVIGGIESISHMSITPSLTVKSHIREGFAFNDNVSPGGYNADGTPKSGAKIVCITAATANTITAKVVVNENKPPKINTIDAVGIIEILAARGKGYDKTPLIIRMIGQVKAEHITGLQGNNFVPFTGANIDKRKIENITFEGVGDDATASGYGFFTKRSKGIEIRNIGIMLFGDDAVSMEADNSHIWIHNCDFFYGKPGSDADQIKGDGTIDMKYNTSNVTISFNHFWDSGKSTFAGGATEANTIYFTYHHNWFDHSDSRHPRLSHATVHVYNNYFDGNAGMGLLNTGLSSAFVEANYYRNVPYPMMINMQGTNFEIWPDGAQNGGITKAFNNKIEGVKKLIYQTIRPTDFDAYLVTDRNEQIPNSVISRKGGNTYSNFDTAPAMYTYNADSPDDVQSIVTTYAGRVNGGDFKWTFNNNIDDPSHIINAALKAKIAAYQSNLVFVQAETTLGVEDNIQTQKIILYPNPVTNLMHLSSSDQSIDNVSIYSLSGILVKSISNVTTPIDVSNLKTGSYLVKVTTQQNSFTKKIIKN